MDNLCPHKWHISDARRWKTLGVPMESKEILVMVGIFGGRGPYSDNFWQLRNWYEKNNGAEFTHCLDCVRRLSWIITVLVTLIHKRTSINNVRRFLTIFDAPNLPCLTIYTRCPMGSTDQADPSCFYFRISWILMERCCFYLFFVPSVFCRAFL